MSGKLTKMAIANAYTALIEEKAFSKITVKDITDRAGINRQTFYYHFRDVYDLVTWIGTEAIREVIGDETDFSNCMMKICDHMIQHRTQIMNMHHDSDMTDVRRLLRDVLSPMMSQTVGAQAEGLGQGDRDTVIQITTLTTSEIILEWIDHGMQPTDRFARLADLVEANMKNTVAFLRS